jgi:hypothetical protein
MMIGSIHGENFRSKLPCLIFAQYRKNGQKFSKKPLTRVLLVSSSPIYDQNISSKAIGQLVPLPR